MSQLESLEEAVHKFDLQIAIDGPAGAGKSTIGQGLSKVLGCPYVDTGLMYRAITWLALFTGVPLSDGAALARLASRLTFTIAPGRSGVLLINHRTPTAELRSPAVDAAVSEVSAHRQVRRELVAIQRALADERCVVMVGRDIGTEVLPNAPVKLWITASAAERANRRLVERERVADGPNYEKMVEQMIARDAHDAGRAVSPLRMSADATVVETDCLTPSETLERALAAVREAVARRSSSTA